MSHATIRIRTVGWRTTFQDLGRRETERLGVPRGGAADQLSARIASILVGNSESATLLETLGGTLSVVPDTDVLVAATGAVGTMTVSGVSVDPSQPVLIPAGVPVAVNCAMWGARTYLALSGELKAPSFLGSTAPDPRMGFPQNISAGDELRLSAPARTLLHSKLGTALFRFPVFGRASPSDHQSISLVECPESESIPGIKQLLESHDYTVNAHSDHVGVRLDGPVAHPPADPDIVSHGVPIGAVEIPPFDEVITLGRYRTLTAGYPVVGFATEPAQDVLGQVLPGQTVRFSWTDHSRAAVLRQRREDALEDLKNRVGCAFDVLDWQRDTRDECPASSDLVHHS